MNEQNDELYKYSTALQTLVFV